MKSNQQLTQDSTEQRRKDNRKKFAWGTEAFDALNAAFGPLKVVEMIDEDGKVYRPTK
jgi:hypothetical protein